MTGDPGYVARRASRDREPIRWEVVDAAGAVARTFGGHHAPTVAERWADDANRASCFGGAAPEAVADGLRNARSV